MQVIDLRRCPIVKRNMELIRDLLIRIEADSEMDGTTEFYFDTSEEIGLPAYSIEELSYNLRLLVTAGFVDGGSSAILPLIIRSLTWEGHEFLDNIRNDDIWNKAKQHFANLPSVGLRIIAAFAEAELKHKFGLT